MSRRSKRSSKKSGKTKGSSKKSRSKKSYLQVISDFDNTMVRKNTAALLIKHYLVTNPHNEPLHRRLLRALRLLPPETRRRHFGLYYEVLRRIGHDDRHKVLANVHIRQKWLRAVKDLRMRYKSKHVDLTILTRNCVDVVHDWVMQNRDELRKHSIRVHGIIANGPLDDVDIETVRQRADLKHIDYVGFGQMMEKQKRNFVDEHSIYVGDADDAQLKRLVKEFVRV